MPRSPTLTVAVVQPPCVARDPAANGVIHAEVVRRAAARVVVFPELSLTGYELDAPTVRLDDDAWTPLITACQDTDSVALVGAPVEVDGAPFIATVAVSATGVDMAYRKACPGGEESERFLAGPGPVVLEVDGWRIGLAICRDTGVPHYISTLAREGVDVVAAGLTDAPDDLAEQRRRAGVIARECGAHVAFASFAGPTGSGYPCTAGHSALYAPSGEILCEAGGEPGDMAVGVLTTALIDGPSSSRGGSEISRPARDRGRWWTSRERWRRPGWSARRGGR